MALPPSASICLTTSAPGCSGISPNAAAAPSWANSLAVASPSPDAPPVMIATLPSSLPIICFSWWCRCGWRRCAAWSLCGPACGEVVRSHALRCEQDVHGGGEFEDRALQPRLGRVGIQPQVLKTVDDSRHAFLQFDAGQ